MTNDNVIPALAELQALPRWVGCILPDKAPLSPHTGRYAKSNDPQTWGTYEQALHAQKRWGWDVLGVALSPNGDGNHLIIVDLDHCGNRGVIEPWAQEQVDRVGSYSEFSPSYERTPDDHGVRILARGKLPGKGLGAYKGEPNNWPDDSDLALKGVPDPPRCPEMYESGRWATITGYHIPGTPTSIEERPDAIREIYEESKESIARHKALVTAARRPEYSNATPAVMVERIGSGGPGDDYNERGPAPTEMLQRHGWTVHHETSEEIAYTRPGKETHAGQSAGWHKTKRVFYNFSGNAPVFDGEQGYSLYQMYTLLEHGGDASAATKALAQAGYGESLYKFELGDQVHAQADDGAVLASGEVANRRHRKEDGEWVNLYRIGDDRAEYSEPMLSGGLRDLTPRTEPTPETEYTPPPEPEWGEPEGATELYEPVALLSLADILADKTPVPPDIVTGMLPGKAAVLLSAPGGDGKSYVTLDLCMCVPRGVGWLGLDTYSTGILVIDLENRKLRFRERLKRCMRGHTLTKPPAVHVTFELNTRLDGDAIIDEIAQLADDCGAGLVILDSLVDFLGETEENSNAEMGRVANRLRAIADAVGGLLVIHHTPKASGATPRGATALRNGIDVNIILSREGNVITLKQDKNRCGPEQSVTARMNWSDGLFNLSPLNVTVGRDEIERKTKSDPDEKAILDAVDDAAGEWVESANVVNYALEQPDTNKRRTIHNKLRGLVVDGILEEQETASGKAYFVRRKAEPCNRANA